MLNQNWKDYLSWLEWRYFVTLTWRKRIDGFSALKFAKKWCRRWKIDRAIFFVENFKNTPSVHLHGLVYWRPDNVFNSVLGIDKKDFHSILWREWYSKHGMNRILPYRKGGAEQYLLKYITKSINPLFLQFGGKKEWISFNSFVISEENIDKRLDISSKSADNQLNICGNT